MQEFRVISALGLNLLGTITPYDGGMKHLLPMPPSTLVTQSSVTVLECGSPMRIDPAPLSTIYAEMGAEGAEDTICRVLEDIARRMNSLQELRRACNFPELVRPAQRLAAVGRQIGLTEVSAAADHVATAADQGDPIALEATLQRLERGFDAAICQIWDVDHVS